MKLGYGGDFTPIPTFPRSLEALLFEGVSKRDMQIG